LGKNPSEYSIELHSGYLFNNDKKLKKLDLGVTTGNIIEMIYENGNLSFKNKKDAILAFKDIPELLFPAVSIMNKDDSVEIVSLINI